MNESTIHLGVFTHAFTIPAASMDGNGHVNNLEYLRFSAS
jgi:acyl-CoA thioesterase FadM